jgi:hypothetical protein
LRHRELFTTNKRNKRRAGSNMIIVEHELGFFGTSSREGNVSGIIWWKGLFCGAVKHREDGEEYRFDGESWSPVIV